MLLYYLLILDRNQKQMDTMYMNHLEKKCIVVMKIVYLIRMVTVKGGFVLMFYLNDYLQMILKVFCKKIVIIFINFL